MPGIDELGEDAPDDPPPDELDPPGCDGMPDGSDELDPDRPPLGEGMLGMPDRPPPPELPELPDEPPEDPPEDGDDGEGMEDEDCC